MRGKILQIGNAREIFSSPASEEIARFVGMENVLEGKVVSNKDCIADISIGKYIIEGISSCREGGAVNIFIRPEDITLFPDEPESSARNVFSGRITTLIPTGPLVR
jgi:ABC-type Fe3+/spermidine/putrescine transport system ATPase subunit